MQKQISSILLADDDEDDCALFTEALPKSPLVRLNVVHDGEALMKFLNNSSSDYPDILFLDLNMPRKNGMECLLEIKQDRKWEDVTVIIYSTSYQEMVTDQLYDYGADYFMQKPASFTNLKLLLQFAFSTVQHSLTKNTSLHPSRDQFRISLNRNTSNASHENQIW